MMGGGNPYGGAGMPKSALSDPKKKYAYEIEVLKRIGVPDEVFQV
jgi:hypothetical protein